MWQQTEDGTFNIFSVLFKFQICFLIFPFLTEKKHVGTKNCWSWSSYLWLSRSIDRQSELSHLIWESEAKPAFSSWAFSSPSSRSTARFCSTSCLTSCRPWPSNCSSWGRGFIEPAHTCADRWGDVQRTVLKRFEHPYSFSHKTWTHLGVVLWWDVPSGLVFIAAVQIIVHLIFVFWARLCRVTGNNLKNK